MSLTASHVTSISIELNWFKLVISWKRELISPFISMLFHRRMIQYNDVKKGSIASHYFTLKCIRRCKKTNYWMQNQLSSPRPLFFLVKLLTEFRAFFVEFWLRNMSLSCLKSPWIWGYDWNLCWHLRLFMTLI